MRIIHWLAIVLLSSTLAAEPPTISLPATVEARAGKFTQIPATTNGKIVRWFSPDATLDIFPTELLKDTKTAVVVPSRSCTLYAYTALGDEPSLLAECKIVVGGTPPPPPPPPPPGDFAALAAKSKALALVLADPPTSAAIATGLEAVLARPPPATVLAARVDVQAAVEAALLARKGASRTRDWLNLWRLPIEAELKALRETGRFEAVLDYFGAVDALAKSLR